LTVVSFHGRNLTPFANVLFVHHQREWKQRTSRLYGTIFATYAKYHVAVLLTRLFEYILSLSVDELVLDALTTDTTEYAKRKASVIECSILDKEMFGVCWRAKLLPVLADYSVHQLLLLCGYYRYVVARRMEIDDEELHIGFVVLSFLKQSTCLAFAKCFSLGLSSIGGVVGSYLYPGWGTRVGSNIADMLSLRFGQWIGLI
jgi:hypothetical protein